MSVPECEVEIGLETYGTKGLGINGKIKRSPVDFVVKEILIDGSIACDDVKFDRSGQGEHLVCILKKEGWDTLIATKEIAKGLKVGLRRIRFAGLKDKDALTYQFISVWNVSPAEVKGLKIDGVDVIPFAFSRKPISLSELLGNSFHITISQIKGEAGELSDNIRSAYHELMTLGGAPNFFGHQRFGIARPVTHLVGRNLVKGEFEKAAKTYLAYNKFEETMVSSIRKTLSESWDFEQALRNFPRSLVFEQRILRYLSTHERDFIGALRELPDRLTRLFVQAYQSYIFNRILSRRIKLGIPINEAQIGDYIVRTGEKGLPSNEAVMTSMSNITHANSELKKGKMYFVIPLLGFNTVLSDGVQGEIENKVLEEENIELKDFLVKEMPELSQAGGFRTAIAPIRHFNHSEPLSDSLDTSSYALILDFDLHKGSYATAVLREIMKPSNPILSGF